MKRGRGEGHSRNAWLCLGICLMCAVLIKPVQDRLDARLGKLATQEPDVLFFSSPSLIKKMALGYDSLLADIYWMRTIQYYGRREEAEKRAIKYKNLPALLDITTSLDPHLTDAYRSGSSFLAEADPIGAGQPLEAVKLLDKGIRAHPEQWELVYDKGFIYYWYMRDYRTAGEVWLSCSRIRTAPFWMPSLAAMSLSKGASFEIAIALWQREYRESDRDSVRENARNHLLSFEVARDIWTLELLIEKHLAKTGNFPSSLQELLRSKKHKYNTIDPLGTPYKYDPEIGAVTLSPDSKVRFIKVPDEYREQLRLRLEE